MFVVVPISLVTCKSMIVTTCISIRPPASVFCLTGRCFLNLGSRRSSKAEHPEIGPLQLGPLFSFLNVPVAHRLNIVCK